MKGIFTNKEIKFDRYGDISFLGNDIEIISNKVDIIHQNVVDRIITNIGNYKYNKNYGANLSYYIGKNAHLIESNIVDSLTRSFTEDNFMDRSMFTILTFLDNDIIHLRIDVGSNNGLFIYDSIKINAVFNSSSGTLHVTN